MPDLEEAPVNGGSVFSQLYDSLSEATGVKPVDFAGADDYIRRRLERHQEIASRVGETEDDWEDVRKNVSQHFPGVELSDDMQNRYQEARSHAQRQGQIQRYARSQGDRFDPSQAVQGIGERLPFVGGFISAGSSLRAKNAYERIQRGEGTAADYEDVGNVVVDQRESQNRTWAGQVLNGISHLPGFATEMAMTGGTMTATRDAATRVLGESLLARSTATALGFGAQTLANPGMIARETTERMMPRELGGHNETFLQALPFGFGSAYIETASEYASELLPGYKPWKGTGAITKPAAEILNRAHFGGVLGEMFEERVGELARGITGISRRPDGTTDWGMLGALAQGDINRFLNDASVEATTFAVPGAAGNLARFRQWSQRFGMPTTGGPVVQTMPEVGQFATQEQRNRHEELSARLNDQNLVNAERWLQSAPVEELQRWAQWAPLRSHLTEQDVRSQIQMRDDIQRAALSSQYDQVGKSVDLLQTQTKALAAKVLEGLNTEFKSALEQDKNQQLDQVRQIGQQGTDVSQLPAELQEVPSPAPLRRGKTLETPSQPQAEMPQVEDMRSQLRDGGPEVGQPKRRGKKLQAETSATGRDALVEQHMGLANHLASKYPKLDQDAYGTARLALVQAADEFTNSGKKFTVDFQTHASAKIRQALNMESGDVMGPGRDMRELIGKFKASESRASNMLGRPATFADAVDDLNASRKKNGKKALSEKQVQNLREAIRSETSATGQVEDQGTGTQSTIENVPAKESPGDNLQGQDAHRLITRILVRDADSQAARALALFTGFNDGLPRLTMKAVGEEMKDKNGRPMTTAQVKELISKAIDSFEDAEELLNDADVEFKLGKNTLVVPETFRDAAYWAIANKIKEVRREVEDIPKQPRRGKKYAEDTLYSIINKGGKIRNDSAVQDYRDQFADIRELQFLIVNNLTAKTLDEWAEQLVKDGDLLVPSGRNATDYLVEQLVNQAVKRNAQELTKTYDEEYNEYLKNQQDSVRAEREASGAPERESSPGETSGQAQGQIGDEVNEWGEVERGEPASADDKPFDLFSGAPSGWGSVGPDPSRPGHGNYFDTPVSTDVRRDANGNPITKGLSDHGIAETIGHIFETPTYIPDRSILGNSKAHAVFRWLPEAVEIDQMSAGSIGIRMHEVAHHLDKTFDVTGQMPKEVKAAIRSMDYEKGRKDLATATREGFAELVRVQATGATNPATPEIVASWWNGWLNEHQDVQKKMERVRALIEEYKAQGPHARQAARSLTTKEYPGPIKTPTERAKDFVLTAHDKVMTAMVDHLRPLMKLQEYRKKRGKITDTKDVWAYDTALALMGTAPNFAKEALERRVVTFRMGEDGKRILATVDVKPLAQIFKGLGRFNVDEFMTYVDSFRDVEDHDRGLNVPNQRLEDARAILADVSTDAAKQSAFRSTLDGWVRFNNAILQIEQDVGLITQEEADKFREDNPNYIPGARVGREKKQIGEPGGMLPYRRRTGSGLPGYNPIQATIERLNLAYAAASRQMVLEQIFSAIDERTPKKMVQGLGKFVVTEPAHFKPPVNLDMDRVKQEIGKLMKSQGIESDMLDELPDGVLKFFFPQSWYEGSQNVMPVKIGGETRFIRFVGEDGHQLFQALTRLSEPQLIGPIMKTFSLMTKSIRLGATVLNPAFALARNLVRDAQQYLMTSKEVKGLEQFTRPLKYLGKNAVATVNEMRGKDLEPFMELHKMLAGDLQQHMGMDPGSLNLARRRLIGSPTKLERFKGVFDEVYQGVTKVLSISEAAPRLAEFTKVLEDAGYTSQRIAEMLSSGDMSIPMDVVVRAINAASDVTVNFKRHGTVSKQVGAVFAYFNARVQGVDKFARNFEKDPVRAAWAFSIMAGIYVSYLMAHPDDDPFWDIEDDTRLKNWIIMKDGRVENVVPMANEWSALLLPIDSLYRATRGKDPKVKNAIWRMFLEFQPVGTPSGISIAEGLANRNFRTGKEIVSSNVVQNRLPEDQVNAGTMAPYRWLGEQTGTSPAIMQHVASGLTGGLATGQGFNPDRLLFKVNDERIGAVNEFRERVLSATQHLGSEKKAGRPLTDRERAQYQADVSIGDLLTKIASPGYSLTDRDERWRFMQPAIGLSRWALDRADNATYQNPLRNISSLPPEVQGAVRSWLNQRAMEAMKPRPLQAATGQTLEQTRRDWEMHRDAARMILERAGLTPAQAMAQSRKTGKR